MIKIVLIGSLFVAPLVQANPFVEYSEVGKDKDGAATLDDSQSRAMLAPKVVEEEVPKDIKILGLIGDKIAVSIDGRTSTVWDGTEIGPCVIAYPEVLCTSREKERHQRNLALEKLNVENNTLRRQAVTLEQKSVDLSHQVSFYQKAVKLSALLDAGQDVYIPGLSTTARTYKMEDNSLLLRTDIGPEKVAAILSEKASDVYAFSGQTYAIVPGGGLF